MHHLPRRATLLGLGASLSFGGSALALAAAATDQRFVVVLLRGALDGLSAVQPYGDPNFAAMRGDLALPNPGKDMGVLDLGGFHGLHPSLEAMHGLYKAGELAIVHAVAGHYRSRSHFDAQDYLESGADHRMTSGWLNRATAALPAPPGKPGKAGGSELALSVGATVALLLRGPAPVGTWLPQSFAQPAPDLYRALVAMHHADPVTGPAITQGLRERGFTEAVLNGTEAPKDKYSFPALAEAAGKLLAAPDGPRIAALEIGGWDTHAGQRGRLPGVLATLDKGIAGLKTGLGAAWSKTAVLVMTEFGRTVHINGTGGTDHGTGGVAFLAGGAIHGGRILGTWPGLAANQLFENRDLAPTTDLRSVAKGLLAAHLRLPADRLAAIFPDSNEAVPLAGLLKA